MPDFVLDHTQQWLDHFTRQSQDAKPLAAGVEGAIYDLGDGLIAKVWRERRAAELERMQSFYADVAAAGLPFRTPEILRVEQVSGTSVTYERKLPGEPLQGRLDVHDREIGAAAVRCVIDILRGLATVQATTSMRQLAVLDEHQPLWANADTFRSALRGLLDRRAARFGPVIREHLPDFDHRYSALRERLATFGTWPDTVIHGDLLGGNILVDDQNRPLAVLDFGFLTTAGDPRLDAAITANVMNMYGPHAPAITQDLTARIARDLGYPTDVLLTYQAAYAVATSNAFTPDGSDGHFAWCIAQLRRTDISEAIDHRSGRRWRNSLYKTSAFRNTAPMAETDEKQTLHRYLRNARGVLLWKLEGLGDYDIRRPLTPTGTNLLGLVKHCAGVECQYFGEVMGRPFPGEDDLDWHHDDDDELSGHMYATASESREQIADFYRRVWAHSDATIGELPLDARGTVPWWPQEHRHPTLHTLLVHTISETARHAGHADIIRESIDGAAGLLEGVSNMPSEAGTAAWKQHYDKLDRIARSAL